jgi:hypothetical protein
MLCLLPACTSLNVDPIAPKPHTGYVDLFTPGSDEFSWDVKRFDDASGTFKPLFSQFDPVQGRILRLALPPGHHRLRVAFLNRVIVDPAIVDVEVVDGHITPVLIAAKDEGQASVRTRTTGLGSTVYGQLGRHTRIGSVEADAYRLTATVQAPVAYQRKAQMPYAVGP